MKKPLLRIFALSACLASECGANLRSQPNQDAQGRDFGVRVAVQEVRIDAVVLDKNKRQVTDLTAGDFEVKQDGKDQKVIACTYVNEYLAPPGNAVPSIMSRNKVHRTMAFLVDDLTMSFQQMHFARMALQKFVETQMQSGDLVAILRTSLGSGAIQQFTSDTRELISIIKSLRWGESNALLASAICGPGG
jgi:VWFA-related protein